MAAPRKSFCGFDLPILKTKPGSGDKVEVYGGRNFICFVRKFSSGPDFMAAKYKDGPVLFNLFS